MPRLVRRALPLAIAAAAVSLPAAQAQVGVPDVQERIRLEAQETQAELRDDDVTDEIFDDGKERDVPNATGTVGDPASEDEFSGDPSSPDDLDRDLIKRDGDVAQESVVGAFDRQVVRTEQLATAVGRAIDQTRLYAGRNPDLAIVELKQALLSVQTAEDVNPVVRAQLERQLEAEIQQARNLSIQANENELLRQVRESEEIAALRALEALRTEEENLEQLIDQVRASIDDAVHGDDFAYEEAEDFARAAVNLRPGNMPATAAVFTSEAAGQLNKAFRLRSIRNDRFLETLYQVELSHVPFPDEPPVRFPAAAVWEELSRRRKARYSAVSLQADSAAEERIRAALDQPTSLAGLRPGDTLAEALDALAGLHQITILPDNARLDLEGIDLRDLAIENPPVLEGVKLKSALKLLLESVNDVPLTYIVEDEVMKITTQDYADERLFTRVYPVGDLVIPIMSGMMGGMGGMMGGMGGGMGGMGGGMGGMGGGMGGMGGGGFGGGAFSLPPETLRVDGGDAAEKKSR
ncbi:hypothetical protein [Alienimonas sp. DA493]|uniref:hypothetical protein n=1 Tax=Alienimonas sp. DA493 TaxID=3373605 RepID=UPI003754ABA5